MKMTTTVRIVIPPAELMEFLKLHLSASNPELAEMNCTAIALDDFGVTLEFEKINKP